MNKLTEQQIKDINDKCPYNQGVFVQPYGIPSKIKEPVIYGRYSTGGYEGGNCWEGKAYPYSEDIPKDRVRDISGEH